MRMRVVAALTAMALGAAACGEPSSAGQSAEPAPLAEAAETTTTTDPGPPRYNVSLDVHYWDDSYRPIAVSPKTWGFEIDYRVEATLSEDDVVELDPPAEIHWWVKCHDPGNWDPLPDLSWDVEEQATWLTDGPMVSVQVHDEELWLVHRLPSQAQLPRTRRSCEESIASHFTLGWGGSSMQSFARAPYDGWTSGAVPGHLFYGDPDGPPDYIETDDEYAGFVVWAAPLADLGIATQEVDYSLVAAEVLHVWNLFITGTISRASN